MMNDLSPQLAIHGLQARVVPIHHLSELRQEIEDRCRQGLLDQDLYQTYLAGFDFTPPDSLPGATAIFIVAVPQPRTLVTFTWDGEEQALTIPPTYPERETNRRVRELLAEVLAPEGYGVAAARLPKKLLAARSGLAAYGKNNITYVPGMGSFHGLVALFCDLPLEEDHWGQPQMLDRCQNCSACRRACAVGAISPDRFLLHAERCITFHNEKPSEVPFPAWIDPSWHNSLVGCMHCQRVCPENRDVWEWTEEGAAFSEEETALLLEGVPLERLPQATVQKLARVEMDGYADVLPRNLRAMLDRG